MKRRRGWWLGLALGWAATGVLAADVASLVQGNTAFALELHAQLRQADGNLFFSPYSISSALGMTYAGARANTAAEMERALHFGLGQEGTPAAFSELQAKLAAAEKIGGIQLAIVHSLWPQEGYPFLPDYLETARAAYDSTITPLDIQGDAEGARQTINAWVARRTQDKIQDLIGPGGLDALTRLVLVNAIYFKGNWASPFQEAQTAPADFFVTPDAPVPASLMAQTRKYPYAEFDDCQVVKLSYAGNGLSMVVVLPKAQDGLAALESQLTPERLAEWRGRLGERQVCVHLPKFKLTWGVTELNLPLQALGMASAFDAKIADFSGMDGQLHWLYVGSVLHKAFVEVNEEGTEAAAATAVVMKARAMRPAPPAEFRADHPFLFLIQEEETGAILFLGRMVDPTKAD